MRNPNGAEIEAIQRLASRPEGLLFLEYLKANMDNIMQQMIATNDPQLTRAAQGEARVLDVLLKVWK